MAAILLFAILFGESLAAGSPLPDLPGGGSLEKWEQPWRQMTDSGEKRITDYPYYPETEEKALTVYNQVPKIGDGEWMVLRNAYQTVRVAVDGETVFQYEGGFVGSRRPITGSFLCMVPLKAEYSGKTISVELTSPDRAALQVASPIRMGTAAEIRFTVFQSNRGVLLLGETWSKLIRLVQERIQMEVYKKMAYQDVLTGLGNRTAFEERIEELEESLAAGSLVSLAMLDLNGLKQVNDTGRHRAGDQLLRDIAGCLRRAFEGMGECYRIGGDEFAVLFPGTEMTNDTCRTMVHRELARFHEETGRELSISGGCVSSRVEEKGKFRISGMMEQADALMYEEKRMFHGSRDGEGK